MKSPQCDYATLSGHRCTKPGYYWQIGRHDQPFRCCYPHKSPQSGQRIHHDAPDRTEEYQSLGNIRITVDDELGYHRLLGRILDIHHEDLDPCPKFIWLPVDFIDDANTEHVGR